jgi:hypothetical protein
VLLPADACVAQREELDGERALIKMIMRYIGVLHDVKATEKSIAAGGVDSVKDPETGVSDPYADMDQQTDGTQKLAAWSPGDESKLEKTKTELEDKIKLLAKLAQKTGLPGTSQKLAVLLPKSSKLAVYKESVEVAKILKDMLDDIATRRIVIDKVDEQAKKLLDEVTAKMVEWEVSACVSLCVDPYLSVALSLCLSGCKCLGLFVLSVCLSEYMRLRNVQYIHFAHNLSF